MGNIFQKAQQEQAKSIYEGILDKLEGLPADTPGWKDVLKDAIDDMVKSETQPSTGGAQDNKSEAWDFTQEKTQDLFVSNDEVVIRPVTKADEAFYLNVRMQYSLMYRAIYHTTEKDMGSLFWNEVSQPEVFYCIIESAKNKDPIGYLGIKDTRAETWEIAIELDEKHTRQGYGPQSIVLFLNEVYRITGRSEFRAVVEVDNLPSQKCFEKIGAELMGLCNGVILKTDDEKKHFEDKNLDLINDDMIRLAERLGVEPRKLLSHLLDYRYIVK